MVTTTLEPGSLDMTKTTFDSSGHTFPGLDRFNRTMADTWSNGVGSILQKFEISYDDNSNIMMVKDEVLDASDGTQPPQ